MEQPTPQGSVVRWGHWAPLLSLSDRQPPFLGGGHRARPHLHSGPGPGWLTALLGASTGWGWPWRGRAPPRAWPCCPCLEEDPGRLPLWGWVCRGARPGRRVTCSPRMLNVL